MPDDHDRPSRRVTGRILSLGFPLPGVRVDNYTFASAPAFFDYDALVVDPAALGALIASIAAGDDVRTYADAPVVAVSQTPNDVALTDLIARRRDETARLLAHGGVIACFAQPETRYAVGASTVGTYDWLDAAPPLVTGEGASMHIVDYGHALAPFLLSQSANVAYRSHIDTGRARDARVIAQSYGGAVIAAELPSPGGRVALLPALKAVPAGDARYAMSEALQAGIRRMLGALAEGREPHWLAAHDIPGLPEREHALADARAVALTAEQAVGAAAASVDELARYRALLWQEGAAALEPAVIDALRLIGFQVYAQNPDELELREGDTNVLVEVDAAEGAVGMAAHYRLRQRIERAIERRGTAPRGLIVVNGYRLLAPTERSRQASDQLRLAAETMRYCVVPASALFDAVVAHLGGDADAVAAFRRLLASTDGYVESFRGAC